MLLLFAAGCAVGPDYTKPEVDAPVAFDKPIPQTTIVVAHWTEIYADPELIRLVRAARENNRSLAALYYRTLQARSFIDVEEAERLPQINSQVDYTWEENAEQFDVGTSGARERYGAALTPTWELDVFGRVERLVQAAQADAYAEQAAYEDLLLITETDVAINYFRLRALQREIFAVERSVETRRESLNIVNQRFQGGAVSELDVAQAESILAETEADLSQLLVERDVLIHAVAVLTGEFASSFKLRVEEIAGVPVNIPVGLPSELLQRRPDIREAEQRLIAANARIGVAEANLLPRITIGGDLGFAATDAVNWFNASSFFYSLGPKITIPIFQGGRLRAELSAVEFAQYEALEIYYQTVLEAFSDVENALSGWRHLSDQRQARQRAAAAAERAQTISLTQYRSGIIDFITVLDSERTALDAERRLAQVIGDEYENSVLLIRAIGGNW